MNLFILFLVLLRSSSVTMALDPHDPTNLQVFVAGAGLSILSIISFQLARVRKPRKSSAEILYEDINRTFEASYTPKPTVFDVPTAVTIMYSRPATAAITTNGCTTPLTKFLPVTYAFDGTIINVDHIVGYRPRGDDLGTLKNSSVNCTIPSTNSTTSNMVNATISGSNVVNETIITANMEGRKGLIRTGLVYLRTLIQPASFEFLRLYKKLRVSLKSMWLRATDLAPRTRADMILQILYMWSAIISLKILTGWIKFFSDATNRATGLRLWSFSVTIFYIASNFFKTAIPYLWSVLKTTLHVVWILLTTLPVLFFGLRRRESRGTQTEDEAPVADSQSNAPNYTVVNASPDAFVVPPITPVEGRADATSQEDTRTDTNARPAHEKHAEKKVPMLAQESPYYAMLPAPLPPSSPTPPRPRGSPSITLSRPPMPVSNMPEAPVAPTPVSNVSEVPVEQPPVSDLPEEPVKPNKASPPPSSVLEFFEDNITNDHNGNGDDDDGTPQAGSGAAVEIAEGGPSEHKTAAPGQYSPESPPFECITPPLNATIPESPPLECTTPFLNEPISEIPRSEPPRAQFATSEDGEVVTQTYLFKTEEPPTARMPTVVEEEQAPVWPQANSTALDEDTTTQFTDVRDEEVATQTHLIQAEEQRVASIPTVVEEQQAPVWSSGDSTALDDGVVTQPHLFRPEEQSVPMIPTVSGEHLASVWPQDNWTAWNQGTTHPQEEAASMAGMPTMVEEQRAPVWHQGHPTAMEEDPTHPQGGSASTTTRPTRKILTPKGRLLDRQPAPSQPASEGQWEEDDDDEETPREESGSKRTRAALRRANVRQDTVDGQPGDAKVDDDAASETEYDDAYSTKFIMDLDHDVGQPQNTQVPEASSQQSQHMQPALADVAAGASFAQDGVVELGTYVHPQPPLEAGYANARAAPVSPFSCNALQPPVDEFQNLNINDAPGPAEDPMDYDTEFAPGAFGQDDFTPGTYIDNQDAAMVDEGQTHSMAVSSGHEAQGDIPEQIDEAMTDPQEPEPMIDPQQPAPSVQDILDLAAQLPPLSWLRMDTKQAMHTVDGRSQWNMDWMAENPAYFNFTEAKNFLTGPEGEAFCTRYGRDVMRKLEQLLHGGDN